MGRVVTILYGLGVIVIALVYQVLVGAVLIVAISNFLTPGWEYEDKHWMIWIYLGVFWVMNSVGWLLFRSERRDPDGVTFGLCLIPEGIQIIRRGIAPSIARGFDPIVATRSESHVGETWND